MDEGDKSELFYKDFEVHVDLTQHTHPRYTELDGHCWYSMSVYPSDIFHDAYISFAPLYTTITLAVTFFLIVLVFFTYDKSVERRNTKLLQNAARSNAVVTSLFPGTLRDKIIKRESDNLQSGSRRTTQRMKSFLHGNVDDDAIEGGLAGSGSDVKPLAELFLSTTVFFGKLLNSRSYPVKALLRVTSSIGPVRPYGF